MATPAQHLAAAEAGLTRLGNPAFVGPTNGGLLIYQAHAHLAQALGTGTHYTTADELLATLRADGTDDAYTELTVGNQALLHAVLADR